MPRTIPMIAKTTTIMIIMHVALFLEWCLACSNSSNPALALSFATVTCSSNLFKPSPCLWVSNAKS